MNKLTSGSNVLKFACYSVIALIGVSVVPTAALACSVSAWTGTNTVAAADAVEGMRYQGVCGLRASISGDADDDNSSDYVEEKTSFSAENAIKAIFYVNADDATLAAGDKVVIYRLLDSADASQLDVSILGGQVVLGDATTGATLNSGWNSVQVSWANDGNASVSVKNETSTVATATIANAGTSSVDGIRLGFIEQTGSGTGTMLVDSFIANRTTDPTRLLNCDANLDGSVSSGDISAVILDFLSPTGAKVLANGTPDCNGDGVVSSGDISGIIIKFLSPAQ